MRYKRLAKAGEVDLISFPIDYVLGSESIRPTGVGKGADSVVRRNARRFYGRYGMERNPYDW